MNTLKIKWERLVSNGQTCPRCGSTEEEIEKAIAVLKQSLAPLEIAVILEKSELSAEEFERNPLESNKIWINSRSLEEWIDGAVGRSPCCDVCGPAECRTVKGEGEVYETIPADLIIKAGLLAASKLINAETSKSCCENNPSKNQKPTAAQNSKTTTPLSH
ncbi:MAG: DUF2703 domain-containing protein [Candidatus Bathyarchaeia archaeon]